MDIHPYVAAATITLAIILPSLALIFLARKLVKLDAEESTKPMIIGSQSSR